MSSPRYHLTMNEDEVFNLLALVQQDRGESGLTDVREALERSINRKKRYWRIWSTLIKQYTGKCSERGRADVIMEDGPGHEFHEISEEEFNQED